MQILNVEIKAWCDHPVKVERKLTELGARFHGIDNQIDTYFMCPNGRLKIREGDIENALIHYSRENQEGPKTSNVDLIALEEGSELKRILSNAFGIFKTVSKERKIFYLGNIKIHLDHLESLGFFIEIEAMSHLNDIEEAELRLQCFELMEILEIDESRLITGSYSDMVK